MTAVVLVATVVAGGLAALLRFAVSLVFSRRALPWAVLLVNVAASVVGGAVLGLATVGAIDDGVRLVLLSGVAGGLSTFSTFSVETVQLVRSGRRRVAIASVTANLVLGIGAAAAGYAGTVAFFD